MSINLKRYAAAMSSLTIEKVRRSCGHTQRTGWHNRPQLSGPVQETLHYERLLKATPCADCALQPRSLAR